MTVDFFFFLYVKVKGKDQIFNTSTTTVFFLYVLHPSQYAFIFKWEEYVWL